MSIAKYVENNFKGMLVFGDIHSDYTSFLKAYTFAKKNNFFFMSLGDLVDRGENPYDVVIHMHFLVKNGHGGFTIGNHDDKFYRFHKGKNVSFSRDGKQTFDYVGVNRHALFLEHYTDMIDTLLFSSLYHKFDDIILVHAASHPSMWDDKIKFDKSANSRALVGETNGEKHENGLPIRLYNWIDEIPMGKTVIVGHDRSPIHNVNITAPLIKNNANGGKAVFIDTGCGKGGFLTGAIVLKHKNRFVIDSFEEFK